jgi:hypothetical protein
MGERLPALMIATPTHDNKFHSAWTAGALDCMVKFHDRIAIEHICGSFLPRSRDILTLKFLQSNATHVLYVDSDIGFSAADAQKLLDTGKDFVAGVYCRKQPDRTIPAELTGEDEGSLLGAKHLPAGFLLQSRASVERMYGAFRDLSYDTPFGTACALWSTFTDKSGSYGGEDVSYVRRWRMLGEKAWLHSGVILRHYGEQCYLPEGNELRFS